MWVSVILLLSTSLRRWKGCLLRSGCLLGLHRDWCVSPVSAVFAQTHAHVGTLAIWQELHSFLWLKSLLMTALEDLSCPIPPSLLYSPVLLPALGCPVCSPSLHSWSDAKNSSVWKTPFPPLLLSTHPEWLSLNMTSIRKAFLITRSRLLVLLEYFYIPSTS